MGLRPEVEYKPEIALVQIQTKQWSCPASNFVGYHKNNILMEINYEKII